jgi:hypothetical protein
MSRGTHRPDEGAYIVLTQIGRRFCAGIALLICSSSLLPAQSNTNPIAALGKRMSQRPAFYCNLAALTPKERARHEQLGKKIWAAHAATKELEDGYAFQLQKDKVNLVELAEWITGEDKCCSFFHFEIEVERNRGPLWLKIRGDEGIKKFIQATFVSAGL